MSGKTVTLTKAAQLIGVSTITITRWRKGGKLPKVKPVKIRGKYRYSPEDISHLRAYRDSGEVK